MTSKTEIRILSFLVVFAFLLGGATVAVISHFSATPATSVSDAVLYVCEARDVSGDTADVIALLQIAGWTADPTDHREALYSPACNQG